jgi:PKD repeat protein
MTRPGRPRARFATVPIVLLAILLAAPVLSAGSSPPTAAPAAASVHAGDSAADSIRPVSRLLPSAGPGNPSAVDHWATLSQAPSPPPRDQAAVAFDPPANATILFGGYNTTTGHALNDTWALYNGAWSNLTAFLPTAPSPRWGASLAYDALDNETVLFGGRNATTFFNDTWSFTIAGWANLRLARAPSPRTTTVVDDNRSGNLVLFGGLVQRLIPTPGPVQGLNDTWFFRRGAWSNQTGAVGPGPNATGTAVYDAFDHFTLLLGGAPTHNHQWALYRGKWHLIPVLGTPLAPVLNGTATWDSEGGFVLLFGASGHDDPLNQTWTFRAGTWTNLTANLTVAPSPRANVSLVDDPVLSAVLSLGGNPTRGAGPDLAGVWAFYGVPFHLVLNATPNATDVGTAVLLRVNVTETLGPGFAYTYDYRVLPSGCHSSNVSLISCTPLLAGNDTLIAEVNRSDGTDLNASVGLLVNHLPVVSGIVPTRVSDPGLPLPFNATIAGGTAPYRVLWNFSDGSNSSVLNTTHAFAAPGTYNVSISVTDAVGSASEYSVGVTIDTALSASTGSNRTSTDVGLPISFHSLPAGGTPPYVIAWTFNDGNSTTGPNVTHAFAAPGNYSVEATVTDEAGAIRTATIPVVVAPRPSVGVLANLSTTDPGVSVRFGASLSGGIGPFTYTWNFSDGSTAEGSMVSHAFLLPGPASARVTVTDGNGESTSGSASILVEPAQSLSASIVGTSGCGPSSIVNVSADRAGGVAPWTVSWSFGDGSAETVGTNQTHTYGSSGTYPIVATVTDGVGTSVSRTLNFSSPVCRAGAGASASAGGLPLWAWAGIGALLLGLIVAVLVLRRGRKTPPPPTPWVGATEPTPAVPKAPDWQEDEEPAHPEGKP